MLHTMTDAERIAYLEAQVQRLTKVSAAKLRFKVSEKRAVSVLGLQQFPVTLYKGQWERLIEAIPALQAFIAENNSSLSQGKAE